MNTGLQETPLEKVDEIYFKFEYKNPSGSVKDRGLPFQINEAVKNGFKKFVISSSGNAAISAEYWTDKLGLDLTVFVSPSVSPGKLKRLKKGNSKVVIDKKTVSSAIKYAKEGQAFNLRASTDPNGFIGYENIALELDRQIGKIGSIFIPVSSGTMCYGVAKGFARLNYLPQIHAVQTTSCNIICSFFDGDFQKTEKSLPDALVAKTSVLKIPLTKLIKKSKGFGWVVEDRSIKESWIYLRKHGIVSSFEGAATLAAVRKAKKTGFNVSAPVVCLLTGSYYP